MAKITGLGGAFVRAANPKALYEWYEQHFGITSPEGSFSFPRETQRAHIAVAFFPKTSQYFPVSQPAMLWPSIRNERIANTGDLDGSRTLKGIESSFGSRSSRGRLRFLPSNWNRESLLHADAADDQRVGAFYPSLPLNMRKAHEDLGKGGSSEIPRLHLGGWVRAPTAGS